MKKIISCVIPMFLMTMGSLIAQSHFHGHFNPGKLDSVEVSGKTIIKVIVDSTKTHTIFYLDTNGDSKADYHLDFGPSWYKPVDTTAVRPTNGQTVKIIGGKSSDAKDSLATIVVYQINGKIWREPFVAEWNDLGGRDTSSGFIHHKDPNHGYGHGMNIDSLVTKILTGTALVDTTFKMDRYFIDTDADSIPNYILNFGPFWYKPASGAVRPANGDKITIKAGILGVKGKHPMAIVLELNGKVWRDSTLVHASVGRRTLSNNGSTKVSSLFDSADNIQVQQGKFSNRMTNEFSAQLFESYPENMPSYKGQNIFAAYEVSLVDNKGTDFMWNNGHNGGQVQASTNTSFQFHYTDEQLSFYGLSESNLKVKVWNESFKNWQTVNASINTSTNTATFTSNVVSNYYALSSGSVTSVSSENSIPVGYELQQNYPNPFNPTTTISFSLPKAGNVSLKVYDILGNEVARLVDGFTNAGNYSVQFNGQNLASGVYFYRLQSNDFDSVKKFTLIK